jgi:hypothetical protein
MFLAGCFEELVLLLDQECKRQPDDIVIFVGDLVNKVSLGS